MGIGYLAAEYNQEGSGNTIIGSYAARGNSHHDKSGNVIIGYRAGYFADEAANRNIFIGYQAGYSETDSCKLYIENSNSTSPLIGGDFSAEKLYFDGEVGIRKTSPGAELDVNGRIHAAPHAADKGLRIPTNAGPPTLVAGTSEGDIVWDSSNDNLYVYDGTGFSQISGGSSLWESGTNGVYEDDAGVIVGIDQAQTLANAGFSLAAGDLFIQDQLGVEGNVYTDGSFVAGSSTTYADGSITQSAGSALTVTLGEGSGDDFRVDTSTLVVESDNDRVGIGTTSPGSKLHVDGPITHATATKSSNYTLTDSDCVLFVDTSKGDVTITMPAASSSTIGRKYYIYKTNSANTVFVNGNGSDTVVGTSNTTTQWSLLTIIGYTSTSWIATLQ